MTEKTEIGAVKRWDHSDDEMWEHEVHGKYVLASDFDALVEQQDQTQARLDAMREVLASVVEQARGEDGLIRKLREIRDDYYPTTLTIARERIKTIDEAIAALSAPSLEDAQIGAFVRALIPKLGPIGSQAGKGGNVTAYFKDLDNMKDVQDLHALLCGRFDLIAAIDSARTAP